MILKFPNLETIRLAISSRIISATVARTSVAAAFEAESPVCWVETNAKISKTSRQGLEKIGVLFYKSAKIPRDVALGSWAQLLPLEKCAEFPVTDKTPVLFELQDDRLLPEIATEMLRLGNDRQGVRWIESHGNTTALLRVVGPPYYSLLRALEQSDLPTDDAALPPPRAYFEQSPRVWVPAGYRHPLGDELVAPDGKVLMLLPDRIWTVLKDEPFHDLYQLLDFEIPESPVTCESVELDTRLSVSLSLTYAGGEETPELWVLDQAGQRQLDELVQGADDRLISRLAFAVGVTGAETNEHAVVLRVRPGKQAPPVLVLDAIGYRSYLKLPNLFLPCNRRLHPPLRREAVKRLLAADPDAIIWLAPDGERGFRPCSIPDASFRPLEDWVDYVLDREAEALSIWVEGTQFEFEPFICRDDQIPDDADQGREKRPRRERSEQEESQPSDAELLKAAEVAAKVKKATKVEAVTLPEIPRAEPTALQKELLALEKEFLELTDPADAPERRGMWRDMARLNSALSQSSDAAVCWLNAFWEEPEPDQMWLRLWAKSMQGDVPSLTKHALSNLLKNAHPTASELNHLIAELVLAASGDSKQEEIVTFLPAIQQFLEKQEAFLPVRAVWLGWCAVVRLSQGDVLALARARDRVLERLFQHGLRMELDLPSFLRFAGAASSDRFRSVREHIAKLQKRVQKWSKDPYADLMFAYALARLGETSTAHNLMQESTAKLMKRPDPVHSWLVNAFHFRVQQAINGQPNVDRLPAEQFEKLDSLNRLDRYKVDRLRQHSRILDPHERIEPYRRWNREFSDKVSQEIADLFDLIDRQELATRLMAFLNSKETRTPSQQTRVLTTALELSARLGESYALDILSRVDPLLDTLENPLEKLLILEKGMFLSAHFDQGGTLTRFVARLKTLLTVAPSNEMTKALDTLAGQCFKGLRKLGMRDDISEVLQLMAAYVRRCEEPPKKASKKAKAEAGQRTESQRAQQLRILLHVAAGWLYFGQDDLAVPVLDEARTVLFEGELIAVEQTSLACTYVATLGQAPAELALARLDDLFPKLERITDSYTCNSHYPLSKLDVVDAIVQAVVSDDFTMDKTSRRWLDDDEFLVRRRIHHDVRTALGRAGL